MPGKTKGQPDDNERQPRREGQGNSDQSRDNQDRPRDHPGRLDNAEHPFKVSNPPTAQLPPPPEPRGCHPPPETLSPCVCFSAVSRAVFPPILDTLNSILSN